MYNNDNLLELLEYINPSNLSYTEWINVGMALKDSGFSEGDWDSWSKSDSRYKSGECSKKWTTFNGSMSNVTAGTIVKMALDNGYRPASNNGEFDWDDEINDKIIDPKWIENREISINTQSPTEQLITYIETLFQSDDIVGFVTDSFEKDGRFTPKSSGSYSKTAGEIITSLYKHKDDLGATVGDVDENAGAWIRFNPLDGGGIKNTNVLDFRYALVESDNMDIEKQNAIIRELDLPVACLVHSGGKSIHAIVKIFANSYDEYRKRVDYLYNVCEKNGLEIDKQNRNPSRLSRMPGVHRKGQMQYLIDTNIGAKNFETWKEWVESINDDLPDYENIEALWDNLPEKAEPLIDNILRQGHKMLIAGPSKAGKSFLLINMAVSIAEGKKWLDFQCEQGKVLYVNLELDRASCLHRFKDVYTSLNYAPDSLNNIDIWNLRGKSVPMDKLAPKLIRRASKQNYSAIIIDPIYKIITGDENSAGQMAHFCNQFDKVCTELGCAVIYCHHHSKGDQGYKKAADRASGSGVFARDPDALLDIIELELNDNILKQQTDTIACKVCEKWLDKNGYLDDVSDDDMFSKFQMTKICKENLSSRDYAKVLEEIDVEVSKNSIKTAWRIEGTLREFPSFKPRDLWFEYPIHKIDDIGILEDINNEANSKNSNWKQNFKGKKTPEERKKEREQSLMTAFSAVAEDDKTTLKELAEYLAITEKSVKNRLKDSEQFELNHGKVSKKK